MEKVLEILPIRIKNEIMKLNDLSSITELRLRAGKRICAYYGLTEVIIELEVFSSDLINILKNVSSNSIYSVQNDLNNGFITIEGGHRIGVVGEIVIANDKVKNIKNISSMNIRVAKEYIGVSDEILEKVLNNGDIKNTIILSPPLCGKTTLLRDLIRNISESGKNVTVVDERGEIAPMSCGVSVLDVGKRTDVISYVPKSIGIEMAVRSMAPDVVCTDEIGTEQDIIAIKYLCRSGVKFVTTMHGKNIKDVMQSNMKVLFDEGYIECVIILSKNNKIGTVEAIYDKKDYLEAVM